MKNIAMLFLVILSFFSCQQGQEKGQSFTQTKTVDYEYFTKTYNGDGLSADYELKEIYKNQITTRYQMKDAKYTFKASEAKKSDEADPFGLFIEFKADRQYSSLGGQARQEAKDHYFFIVSNSSSGSLKEKFGEKVGALGVKDYEIFIEELVSLYRSQKM